MSVIWYFLTKSASRYVGDLIAIVLCGFFALAGSAVAVHRFWQYEIFYYDFGIFDQAIWAVSRFQEPIIDHLVVGGKWIFADHFNPSIFFLSPLYWLTDKSEILLIAQSVIVALSGYVLYRIGIKILQNTFLSLAVLIAYLLFIGLQNAVISDFHEVTIATFPLMLSFWAIIHRKTFLYFLLLMIVLGFKESNFIAGAAMGIVIMVFWKKWFKVGLVTLLFSLVYGYIAIKIIIPYFSGGIYQYGFFPEGQPTHFIFGFFDDAIKRKTLLYTFLSFGFLPLLSPAFWFLIMQDFFVRFIPNTPTRWELGLHYNAQLAVIMGVSSIYGLALVKKYFSYKRHTIIGILLIINAVVLHQFILHGPLGLAYNQAFYAHTNQFSFLDNLVKKIPRGASVMTQNNIAVRFTHQKVWLLKVNYIDYKPNYILLDIREGQNANNFFGTEEIFKIYDTLMNDQQYSILYESKEQFIFKRKKT